MTIKQQDILPSSETYEKEYHHFPWKTIINKSIYFVVKNAPKNGKVLDLMCGTGYILNKIKQQRPDLELIGIDISSEFISFAKKNYAGIDFIEQNALDWNSNNEFDIIVCTGGIHHIKYNKQELITEKISKALKKNGKAIFADPFISDYSNEEERKLKAVELGSEYIKATLKTNPTQDVLNASIDIMRNDVLGLEYKTSLKKLKPVYKKYFSKIEIIKTWPEEETEYGDYLIITTM
jgi:2-polyprenyl-3-methyl-5-hydroxy-6-metoxy-1,4-benzoquinol methylase